MSELVQYKEIRIDGVNGCALVRISKEGTTVSTPERDVWEGFAQPMIWMPMTREEADNGYTEKVQQGKAVEVLLLLDATLDQKRIDKYLKEHGGHREPNGGVYSVGLLPDELCSWNVALVDDEGNITPHPEADKKYDWPKKMKINEAFSLE